jgi:hypothetical protein
VAHRAVVCVSPCATVRDHPVPWHHALGRKSPTRRRAGAKLQTTREENKGAQNRSPRGTKMRPFCCGARRRRPAPTILPYSRPA